MFQRLVLTLILGLFAAVPAQAQVLVGEPADGGNCFPFGCGFSGDNTRYQQVYDAASLPSAFDITDISFFLESEGELNQGTFDFFLSTTDVAVNDLSATMDDNLGADNTLFGSFTLGGSAPATLTFSGTPFSYDPSLGNLLLDIQISDFVASPNNSFFFARNDDPSAPFSRMHDFGGGFEGFGLVTEFEGREVNAEVPEPASGLLFASGLLALGWAVRRRERERTG